MFLKLTKRWASALVVVEHKNGSFASHTLNTITAAKELGPVTALVSGGNKEELDKVSKSLAKVAAINKVLVATSSMLEYNLPETCGPLIVSAIKDGGFSHVIAPHSAFGKNLMPRVAALLDVAQISDVMKIEAQDTFTRPFYAGEKSFLNLGNAIAKVKSSDSVKIMTIRTTAFPPVEAAGGNAAVEAIAIPKDLKESTKWVSEELSKSDRPELGSAPVVIGGGRGLKSGDNFKILYDLADKLGGAVGASRAAVDSGFVPNDLQIGQTGKIVAPQLYIAVGISGAIQVSFYSLNVSI